MASGGKMKALADAGHEEPVKRRKVAFTGVVAEPVSCKANDCIKLLFVSSSQEMEDDFPKEEIMCDPQFAERVFGEDGTIYGYSDLEIDLWLQSNTFQAYVDIRFSKKVATGETPPTDIMGKLKETFGENLTDDREAFVKSMFENSLAFEQMITEKSDAVTKPWKIGGESHDESDVPNDEISEKFGQIVRMEITDPAVRKWHKRLNPLSLLYIEGARPIEDDDPLWEIYVALEIQGKQSRITGFCNVYRFYHYPDSTRLRISQILVLPIYQGIGYGLHLLDAVNETAIARGCYDVTMEEPSIALQKIRDTMDVLRLLSMPTLQLKAQVKVAISDGIQKLHSRNVSSIYVPEGCKTEAAGSSNGSGEASQIFSNGVKERNIMDPPRHLREDVRNFLKINKKQFKRCWEQLLFLHLDPQDKELQDVFQSGVIQLLNSELFGKDKELEKHAGKQIFDTENEFDSSKTFVMVRVKAKGGDVPNAPQFEVQGHSALPAEEEKLKALQEALSGREEDLVGVARDVARHCKRLDVYIPTIEYWLKPGTHSQTASGPSSPT